MNRRSVDPTQFKQVNKRQSTNLLKRRVENKRKDDMENNNNKRIVLQDIEHAVDFHRTSKACKKLLTPNCKIKSVGDSYAKGHL